MTIVPYVSRLFVYPLKSFDRVELKQVRILPSGALKCDREFALFDQSGHFVNGKRNAKIHQLRSTVNLETHTLTLWVHESDETATFSLKKELDALANWLSHYFGFPVAIKQNLDMGFPDDTVSPGPTIVSTATLEAIASWYAELDIEDIRLRFRTNIEISGVPPFWEDQLFKEAGKAVDFQIGEIQFRGINPCQRCVVVTRDPETGNAYPDFQKMFVTQRKAALPEWAERSRFNHFYRLAINTQLPMTEAGKTIHIGDELKIISSPLATYRTSSAMTDNP